MLTGKDILFFDDSHGLLETRDKVFIPPLAAETDIWIEKKNMDQGTFSKKQLQVFDHFLLYDKRITDAIEKLLKPYFYKLLDEKIIRENCRENEERFNLKYTQIILPALDEIDNGYLFILADTCWQLTDSDYAEELEILVKDNQVMLLQGYSGLWMVKKWYTQ